MGILLEFFLFLGIFFPIYHILNILPNLFRNKNNIVNKDRFISIIIPCFNEERIIKNTIEGLLRIDYINYECIFINDGSTDKTLKQFKKILKLKKIVRNQNHNLKSKKIKNIYQSQRFPNFFVINKNKGGKGDSLNAGINYSEYNYIVTLDADSILKKDALQLVSGAFNDPNVVAASGIIQILQSFDLSRNEEITTLRLNNLLKLQTIEYIKSCFCYKASLAKLNSLLVISGAFGIFRKDILLDIKGFNDVIGEDLDLTIRIQLNILDTNKKIAYIPEAICFTEGPETFKDYMKQRIRWQKSFIECFLNYKGLIFKEAFRRTLPFFMLVDALFVGVISSFIIVIFSALIIKNIIFHTLSYILIYFIIFVTIHLSYNIAGIFVANHYNIKYKGLNKLRLIFTILLDIFVYRIIILYTIIKGTISYFTNRHIWNKVNRSGRDYNVLKEGKTHG
jgi:cellulose synthase/poly-beta-1,6-N-acetylglucosamine synthase-like glycosyltransferase